MAIDFSPILNAFIPSDLIAVILSVAALLAFLYLVVFSVFAVLVTFRGGSAADQLQFLRQLSRESEYKNRYRRESRNRNYRTWKNSKGLK